MPPRPRYTGTIGVASQEAGRYASFAISCGNLELPPGWRFEGAFNYDLAHARNWFARNLKTDFLFLLDDDHRFEPDVLKRLLEHDVDVCNALYLNRKIPFSPLAKIDGEPVVLQGEPRLIEVDTIGGSGLLIRRSVFERIEFPYFQHGALDDEGLAWMTDDEFFSARCRAAGIHMWLDTGAILHHSIMGSVSPEPHDGRWQIRLEAGGFVFHI